MDAAMLGQFLIILAALLIGAHYGGYALGLISGVGLFIFAFVFHLAPGKPPVDVLLTILAVIACASVLQTAGGLDVMMRWAERLLRRHPAQVTFLAPITTWTLTVMCGTGHVVYTMFPIIYDVAIRKGIRPERPMAAASVASQIGIVASPVSVATVSMVAILAKSPMLQTPISLVQMLAITIPATFIGVLAVALWSSRRGADLDDDAAFQARIADPEQRDYVFGEETTLLDKVFPKEAYWSVAIFFTGIAAVVALGAFASLRPAFGSPPKPLSMNLAIQIVMLSAGAVIFLTAKVNARKITDGGVFKAGMVAIISVFGVAWMADTFFEAHFATIKAALADVVKTHPWTYGLVLFVVSKFVNSQAAAIAAIAPLGVQLGVDPKVMLALMPASYGYFILPTYPSDLACIGFDRSGTTRIGRFVINHSFILPGLIGVGVGCGAGWLLVTTFM